MAGKGSEEVIELGSSDDEVEPAPKRKKIRPDAMIHIPNRLHGVTIKPTTSKDRCRTSISKVLPKNEAVTVTKVSKFINPLSNINNGKSAQKPVVNQKLAIPPIAKPIVNKTQGVNPIHLFKKINSQVVINKVPSTSKVMKIPLRINSPKTINNLPLNINIQRGPEVTRPGIPCKSINPLRQVDRMKHNPKGVKFINNVKQIKQPCLKASNEVLTVDLDDDDAGSSPSGPQWYLRPEDLSKSTLEEENNKEPDQPKFEEITIEDSPVKPKPLKTAEDLAVTIEDSPVKAVAEKTVTKSDEESCPNKTPQSKKRLEYPKEAQGQHVIEIEIEPLAVEISDADVEISQNKPEAPQCIGAPDVIVEIAESPLKDSMLQLTSTPKKNHNRQPVKFPGERIEQHSSETSEFHPVYQNFIKLCFELEDSEDMRKIVEKKVKTYYRQVPKDYTESEQFIDMVSSKILAMRASPDKMYLFIKDIVDELNLQRKMAKTQPSKPEKNKVAAAESENFLYGENSEFDSKRQRQIRKLEKTLKKLHRAIQKLEEQEVDFDDEEDSVYLLTERYKERMMRVHAKFCQLTNTKMPSEPRVQLEPRPGHPAGPAKRLEKWINKKVPIGTPLPFPDFHDVLRCVKEANEEDKLGWNDVDIMEEARDLFTRCGKKLQRRRQENEWRTAVSRISHDADPAENNEELRKKLEQNKQLAAKKEVEVFNKFADKQNQLKLEAEEIGDKEAEESPVESEEEEIVDEESLENKDKRKERLKRLLQEKSKKNNLERENDTADTASILQNNRESNDESVTTEQNVTDDVEMKYVEEGDNKQSKDQDSNIEEISVNKGDNIDNKKTEVEASKVESTNTIESDIDELHLLQKLYSENEVNSSTVDSDSEAHISISDTLDSDSADKKSVISIENSSYSESEIGKIETSETDMGKNNDKSKHMDAVSAPTTDIIKEPVVVNMEIGLSESSEKKKQIQTNNDEYNESIEDILLASTDEDTADNDNSENHKASEPASDDSPGSVDHCGIVDNLSSVEDTVNLKDDNLSIGETVVGHKSNENLELESNKLDTNLDQSTAHKHFNRTDKVSEQTEEENNDETDANNARQTEGILGERDRNVINEDVSVITANENACLNDDAPECVSLYDESSSGEALKENIGKNEGNSPNQDYGNVRNIENIKRSEESKNIEVERGTVSEESCNNNFGQNLNDNSSVNNSIHNTVINDDVKSNIQNDGVVKDDISGSLKESKFLESIITT
ncbi:daxx-like protein [Amyelois transitella]|uniref:daxx-like protein n=1 Tax=Amyelois transitella TaxID=680683 RepID=UPI0029906325|nr:daxx-like protein [Amyelois transitella]